MADFPVNPIDILVALILVISALLAFTRGAVREILGVGAWIGAALATVFGFLHVRPYSRDLIDYELVADAVAGLAIFVVALIILTIVSQLLAGRIQRSKLGALDRTLGIVFGLVRGAVLVSLAYMMFVWAVSENDRPAWVDQAKSMPYIKRGSDAIQAIVPRDALQDAEGRVKSTSEGIGQLREAEQSRQDAEDSLQRAANPKARDEAAEGEPGYSDQDRDGLRSLSDSVSE
ncbi:MAG: CvpA family protein [Alphaproteobacteria bacterium]|jgi:membrane protein required for colicin V production|nr:CvpA family protein [Alphaproteobacteria bacterium]